MMRPLRRDSSEHQSMVLVLLDHLHLHLKNFAIFSHSDDGKEVSERLAMTGMGGSSKPDPDPYSTIGVGGKGRREESQMGRGAMADALGDQSDAGSEADEELEDELAREEKEDKSVRGSVY